MVRPAMPIKFLTYSNALLLVHYRYFCLIFLYDICPVCFLGAASDLKRATSLAKEMVMSYGMADSVSSLFTYKIMTVLFLGSEDIRGL